VGIANERIDHLTIQRFDESTINSVYTMVSELRPLHVKNGKIDDGPMIQLTKLKLIISDAVQFYTSHLALIAALCLPWLVAAALVEFGIISAVQNSEEAAPLFLVAWSFNLLIYPIYTGALIMLMAKRAQREQPTNRELTAASIKIWQPLFMVHIIRSGLTALGFMLFIVPGVYAAVRLSFAEFHLVLEGLKPIEAIQKSFQATRPYFGLILILLAMFMIPLLLLTFMLGGVLQELNLSPILNVTLSILISFLTLFVEVVKFRVYMSAMQDPAV
jgi:hypothetical protein